jgi:hypothetical protein
MFNFKNFKKIKIFRNLIIFIIIVGIILFTLNFLYYRYVIEKSNLYKIEHNYIDIIKEPQGKNFNAIFFGDSHTNQGANPKFINNSFNFGYIVKNYILYYYLLKDITERDNVTVNYLFLEYDPTSFSGRFYRGVFLIDYFWYWKNYMTYQQISDISGKDFIDVYLTSNFPIIGSGKDFSNIILREKNRQPFRGYSTCVLNFSETNKKQESIDYFNTVFRGENVSISPIGIDYFIKIIELAKQHNIKVVLIKYPHSKEFIDVLAQNNLSVKDYYASLGKILDQRVNNKDYTILDYQNLYFNNSDYLCDPTHVNEKGAEDISIKINQFIIDQNNKTKSR